MQNSVGTKGALAQVRRQSNGRLLSCGVIVAVASSALPALAQSDADTTPRLEEIVVTAQKRSEPLQRTALAISAVSADTLETRGIESAGKLTGIAPNLTTTSGNGNSSHLIIHVRGIGDAEPILTADSPVGLYVDGVIIGRSTGAIFDVVDLERVEVLRGPQGTLYGRNTTGGAVNFISRKPADEFGGELGGSLGNLDYSQVRASLDTGLIGRGLKARVSYTHKERSGYVDNVLKADKKDPGATNVDAVRAVLAYDDGGRFRATYSFDYSDINNVVPASQIVAATDAVVSYYRQSAANGGSAFIEPSTDRIDALRADYTPVHEKVQGHALTLEADVGDSLTVRSITGFRKWNSELLNTDLDGNEGLKGRLITGVIGDVSLFGADNDRRQKQWSQEINLIGNIGNQLDFVLGGFYFQEKSHEYNPQWYTYLVDLGGIYRGLGLTNLMEYSHKNRSTALFGQATYHLTEDLQFTGGLRYTRDKKWLDQTSPTPRSLERSWERTNWAATLQYQVTPDVMTFARVATGYKAGGFNPRAMNDGYDPESLTSYELGFKSELLDRRMRLNGNLFHMRLKDKQLNQLIAGTGGANSVTVNAGSGHFTGVELELDVLLTDQLHINGSAGYTKRKVKSFIVLDPTTDEYIDVADEARFNYSASTTFNVGAEYRFGEVAGGELTARLDYAWRSRIYFNAIPRFGPFDDYLTSGPVGLLDGRVALTGFELGSYEATLALWGRNLTDKKHVTSGVDFGSLGFGTVTYSEPRTWGVDMKVRF
ncbi:MAG TPA: TonB-dependent receptor [Pedomonas sp.]|uniref:TonB-dependent receptor n=1 Tax=Pedomonas sp. TaxID=2976421 RepID=UPI002F4076D8